MADKSPWWKASEGSAHKEIVDLIRALDDEQSYRAELNLHHMRLYSNRLALGLNSTDWASYEQSDKLKLNIVKAVVDAATAQISTEKTRPMFLTEKGNYSEQAKGRMLGKFSIGQFSAVKQYTLDQNVFRDACIFGSGFEKIYRSVDEMDEGEKKSKLSAERVFPDELVVDDAECKYGYPRCLYQIKDIASEVLSEEYPDFADEIEEAEQIREPSSHRMTAASPVSVVEAWHLPSCNGAKDGRHVICVSSATLLDEPWEHQNFPFVKFDWQTPVLGYFGIGLAEELCPIQVEINYILQKVQKLMNLATTQVWIQKGSLVNKSITNEDFGVREYSGNLPPVFMTVAAISPEYYGQLDRLWNRGFEVSGVSLLSATSQKPSGLNSGEAIRRYTDVGSKRFLHVKQRWEQFRNDVAEQMIDVARDIEKDEGGYKVIASDKRGIEELKFSDVNLERDKYLIQVHPVAFLPDTPSGKMEALRDLRDVASPDLQAQLINNLDYPDLDAATSLINAPMKLVDLIIERIIDHGDYRPPEPLMNLKLAVPRILLALNKADVEGVPEDRLDLLRRWLSEADALLNPAPSPGTAQGMAQGPISMEQQSLQLQQQAMQPPSPQPGPPLAAAPSADQIGV